VHFITGFLHSVLDLVISICGSVSEPLFKFLQGRRLNEYSQCISPKIPLQVQSTNNIHIKHYMFLPFPDPVKFSYQGTIIMIMVNLFPLQEFFLFDVFSEICHAHEIIILAIDLLWPGWPAAG